MSGFPNSPRLVKGAIVGLDPFNPLASVIVFQYNPSELTRSLTPAGQRDKKNPVGTLRLTGPPKETISVKLTIDAADQLAGGDQIAASLGVYPQLAALEMLLYPKTRLVLQNLALASLGTLEIEPPESALTLFVYGLKRVVPVQISSYSVVEQYHDPNLNPLVAEVNLALDVLSYADFSRTQKGGYVFLAYQAVKEVMAVIGSVDNLAGVASGATNVV